MAGLELDQASKLPVSPSHKTNSTFSPLKPLSNPEENAGSKACIGTKNAEICSEYLQVWRGCIFHPLWAMEMVKLANPVNEARK